MYQRLVPFVWLVASLAFAGCNQSPDNSAQIQALNDKIRDLEQREQELKLQSERDKLDAERAALDAERQNLEAQKAGIASSSPVDPPVFADASPNSTRQHSRRSDRDDSDVDENRPGPSRASYDVFYEDLQEGGHWFNDGTYGYVWQPDVAAEDQSWQPYTDGHWAYTDRGWTWVSNESFGWACYHYGRWARMRDRGWIWVPGDQWAPAWVSWREADDEDYVGWAPLPPECEPQPKVRVQGWVDQYYDIGPAAYVFLKMADLLQPSYRHAVVPVQQNVTLIERTRNITDIYYNNQTVNVFGPRYEQVMQRVNQPIPKYQIDYVTPPQPTASYKTVPSGNRLQVVAPPSRLQPRATAPPRVTQTIQNAQIERGWQNVDPNHARQIRQVLARSEPQVPKDLPPQPVLPPKPMIVAHQSPGQAPAASPVPPAANDLAAQRAKLEAEAPQRPQAIQSPAQQQQQTQQLNAQQQEAAQKQAEQQRQAEQQAEQQRQQQAATKGRELEAQKQQQLKAQQEAAQHQAEQQRAQQEAAQRQQAARHQAEQQRVQQEAAQRQQAAQRQAEQQRAQQEAAQRQAQQQRAQQEAAQRQTQEQQAAQAAAQKQAQATAAQQQEAQRRAQAEAAQRQAQQQAAQAAAQKQAQAAAQQQAPQAAAQRQAQAAAAHQPPQKAQAEKAAAEQRAKEQASPAGQPQ